jgi:hypothetical protein
MSGLGHNNGPTMERGGSWRRYTWTRARAELLPTLPIEVARRRVRRAQELGIDYKSYAGIRAATGRDIVALLFSSNALRLLRDSRIDAARSDRLASLRQVDFLALVHLPHDPARTASANPILLAADRAPGLIETWSETRRRIHALKGGIPADGIVVIGETHLERGWSETARLAGYIAADRYFL